MSDLAFIFSLQVFEAIYKFEELFPLIHMLWLLSMGLMFSIYPFFLPSDI